MDNNTNNSVLQKEIEVLKRKIKELEEKLNKLQYDFNFYEPYIRDAIESSGRA